MAKPDARPPTCPEHTCTLLSSILARGAGVSVAETNRLSHQRRPSPTKFAGKHALKKAHTIGNRIPLANPRGRHICAFALRTKIGPRMRSGRIRAPVNMTPRNYVERPARGGKRDRKDKQRTQIRDQRVHLGLRTGVGFALTQGWWRKSREGCPQTTALKSMHRYRGWTKGQTLQHRSGKTQNI